VDTSTVREWWDTNSGLAVIVLSALVFLWIVGKVFAGFTIPT
jgi:hypothetical protein